MYFYKMYKIMYKMKTHIIKQNIVSVNSALINYLNVSTFYYNIYVSHIRENDIIGQEELISLRDDF